MRSFSYTLVECSVDEQRHFLFKETGGNARLSRKVKRICSVFFMGQKKAFLLLKPSVRIQFVSDSLQGVSKFVTQPETW